MRKDFVRTETSLKERGRKEEWERDAHGGLDEEGLAQVDESVDGRVGHWTLLPALKRVLDLEVLGELGVDALTLLLEHSKVRC